MAIDLINLFKTTVSETLVYQTSELLGESIESTSSAVNSIFPALLSALIRRGNTEAGAKEILEYMAGNNIDGSIMRDLPTILTGGPEVEILKANGTDILKFLVGDNTNTIIDSISNSNGLRTSSSSTLLKIVATLLMTALAYVVNERNLNAAGLRDLLNSQAEYVNDHPQSDLSRLVETLSIAPTVRTAHGTIDVPHMVTPDDRSTLSKVLPWIVLLIAALGLFYFL